MPDGVAYLLKRTHPHIKKKIRASLKMIISDPGSGKALRDELKGLRSFRVSRFRIIYRVTKRKEVEIIAVGPREKIYEDTFRIIKSRSAEK